MSRFTDAAATAQTLSITAMEEASRFGRREADIEHLLLALVISEQVAGQALRGMGLTLDGTREAISAQHAAQLASIGITGDLPQPGRISFHETGGYEWSGRAVDLIERANDGRKRGDAAAVLRELVAEPSGLIEELLRRLGTSPAAVLARLDDVDRIAVQGPPRTDTTGSWSGFSETFVPAPIEGVWALLADPERMPEWDQAVGSVELPDSRMAPNPGARWIGYARTQRPDGRPLRVKTGLRRQQIELVECSERSAIAWRFIYPDAGRANSRYIGIALEQAAGGTQLRVTLAWEYSSRRRRRSVVGVVLSPLYRFTTWIQAFQIGSGISRVFR